MDKINEYEYVKYSFLNGYRYELMIYVKYPLNRYSHGYDADM